MQQSWRKRRLVSMLMLLFLCLPHELHSGGPVFASADNTPTDSHEGGEKSNWNTWWPLEDPTVQTDKGQVLLTRKHSAGNEEPSLEKDPSGLLRRDMNLYDDDEEEDGMYMDQEDLVDPGDIDIDEPGGSVVNSKPLPKDRVPIKIIKQQPAFPGDEDGGGNMLGYPQTNFVDNQVTTRQPLEFSGPPSLKELVGKCFTVKDQTYTYRLCPFHNITQKEEFRENDIALGVWKGWESELSSSPVLPEQLYTDGHPCAIGKRSTMVELKCEAANQLISVREPRSCEYYAVFHTPLACLKEGVNGSAPSAETLCYDCRLRCHKSLQQCTQTCKTKSVCQYAESHTSETPTFSQSVDTSYKLASEIIQTIKLNKDPKSNNISSKLLENNLEALLAEIGHLQELQGKKGDNS